MQEIATTENQPRVPVISSDGYPLIPCRPRRARTLLRDGKATRVWVRGNFAIRMTGRDRAGSTVPEMTLGITPGSKTTGFAVTKDEDDDRRVVHAMELELIGHRISMKLRRRASLRRSRRSRLRYRKPRFDNRCKPQGWLPPSIRHNLDRMLDWTRTLTRLYPVTKIRVSTTKFDTQLMENPNIQGEEYQRGTLHGWQLRAYVFYQNGHRCFYCGEQRKQLTLDHVIPRSRGGTDRVFNLTTACLKCNQQKDNRLPEEFLKDNPEKLQQLLTRDPRRSYQDTSWMNTLMPFLLEGLAGLGLPLEQTNGALTSWNRQQMELAKTHSMDAAILGRCRSLSGMPGLTARFTPDNGRRKQKAQVDQDGTPWGQLPGLLPAGTQRTFPEANPGTLWEEDSLRTRAARHRGHRDGPAQEAGSDNRPGRDRQPGKGHEGSGGKLHPLRPHHHRQAGTEESRVHHHDGRNPKVGLQNPGAEFCNRLGQEEGMPGAEEFRGRHGSDYEEPHQAERDAEEDFINDLAYEVWQENGRDDDLERVRERLMNQYIDAAENPNNPQPGWMPEIRKKVQEAHERES